MGRPAPGPVILSGPDPTYRMPLSTPRLAVLALAVALWGCDSAEPIPIGADLVTSMEVTVDPTGYSPLAARIDLVTEHPVAIDVLVEGKGGPATEIRHQFTDVGQEHAVPVFGLYAGQSTLVTLGFTGPNGEDLGEVEVPIEAAPLPGDYETPTIEVADTAAMRPGVNLTGYFGHYDDFSPQVNLAFDAAGAIRWFLDFKDHPDLGGLFEDNGADRLANGNLFFGDGTTDHVYEVNMFGRIVQRWGMPGFSYHHQVVEKPDGNFLVAVDRLGAATIEDVVIEIHRSTGQIVREWDLRQSLDQHRTVWDTEFADLEVDWFHNNGNAFDPSDNTLIASGRTQGLVKLTAANEVVWILAPHRGWGTAGDGTDLSTKLLQPLDAAGQPITDPAVLDGTATHPDFEWQWYQHSPEVLPDGTVLVFDNGDNRGYGAFPKYSRAVIYDIDEEAMTVRQVWSYGKERGEGAYAQIVSNVEYYPEEDHVFFTPGSVGREGGAPVGKVIEIDRATGAVVFEATVRAPTTPFGVTFHRSARVPLYPPTLRTTSPAS